MQLKFKFIESLIAFTLRTTPVQVGDTLLDAIGKLQGQINERVDLGSAQTIAGAKTFQVNTVFSGDIAVNGGDITTNQAAFNIAVSAGTLQVGSGASSIRAGSFIGVGAVATQSNTLNLAGSFTGNATRAGTNQSTTMTSEPITAARSLRGHSGVVSNLVTTADRAGQSISMEGVLYTAQNGTVDATQDASVTSLIGGRFISTERSASSVPINSVTGIQGNTSHRGTATTTNSAGSRSFVTTESVFTGTITTAEAARLEISHNGGTIAAAYGVRSVFGGPVAMPKIVGYFVDVNTGQTTTLDYAVESGQALKLGHWNTGSNTEQVDLAIAANGDAAFSKKVTALEFIGPLTGNASTASKLEAPRTITLDGDVTGSAEFDGSKNIKITTTSSASSVAFIDGGTFTTNLPSASPAFKVDFGSFN